MQLVFSLLTHCYKPWESFKGADPTLKKMTFFLRQRLTNVCFKLHCRWFNTGESRPSRPPMLDNVRPPMLLAVAPWLLDSRNFSKRSISAASNTTNLTMRKHSRFWHEMFLQYPMSTAWFTAWSEGPPSGKPWGIRSPGRSSESHLRKHQKVGHAARNGDMICDIWCMMICDIWCILMYNIWYMMYNIWYMMYNIWCMIYDMIELANCGVANPHPGRSDQIFVFVNQTPSLSKPTTRLF